MGELPQQGNSCAVSSANKKPRNKKALLGGPMMIEEIRMNKELLKEINKMKKD
jgi:hypothetical protein